MMMSPAWLAESFRKALKNKSVRIISIGIDPDQPLRFDFWSTLVIREAPSVLVLWLNAPDMNELNAISIVGYPTPRLYLSFTLV